MGTLRFDLSALAASKGKDGKKKAVALNKEFIASVRWGGGGVAATILLGRWACPDSCLLECGQVEALDFALRSKAKAPALEKLGKTKAALDAVLAAVS